jgi:hypothetical protein
MYVLQANGTDRRTPDRTARRQPAVRRPALGPACAIGPTRPEDPARPWPRFLIVLLRALSAWSA